MSPYNLKGASLWKWTDSKQIVHDESLFKGQLLYIFVEFKSFRKSSFDKLIPFAKKSDYMSKKTVE